MIHIVGLSGVGLLIILRLLLLHAGVRRAAREWLGRCAEGIVESLNQPPAVDELAAHLAEVFRHEQLLGHVDRLRRTVATDMTMSATRQLGNRLALDWLLRELEESERSLAEWLPGQSSIDPGAVLPLRPLKPSAVAAEGLRSQRRGIGYVQPAPAVEVLEIGWRR